MKTYLLNTPMTRQSILVSSAQSFKALTPINTSGAVWTIQDTLAGIITEPMDVSAGSIVDVAVDVKLSNEILTNPANDVFDWSTYNLDATKNIILPISTTFSGSPGTSGPVGKLELRRVE